MQTIDILNPTDLTGDELAPAAIRWPSGSPESPSAELSTALAVRHIETEAELSALAGDWNRLAGDVPFRQFEWVESWWRHYRREGWRLYTLVVADASGRTVAIAPWHVTQSAAKGRVVQFLGSGEVCSEYLTVLTEAGRESAVAAALAEWLTTEGADDWDLLLLEATNADDPAVQALSAEFTVREHTIHERPGIACWRTELPNDWDEFLQGLSKSRRDRVRKLVRQNFDTGRAQNFPRRRLPSSSVDSRFWSICISAAARAWGRPAASPIRDSPLSMRKSASVFTRWESCVWSGPNWKVARSRPNTISSAGEPFTTTKPGWSLTRSTRIPVGSVWPARCGARSARDTRCSIFCAATKPIKARGARSRRR